MPIYKVVSQEYLEGYRENLEMLINDFYNGVSFGSVMYFILRLSDADWLLLKRVWKWREY